MPLPYLCNIKSNEMYNLKNKIIMKALVLSVVFALTSVVNAVSGNNVKDFAYNSEKQENGVETQTVYKASTWNVTCNTTTHMMKKDVYPQRKS